MTKALVLVLFLGTVFPLSVVAATSLVRFEGGIGVIPVRFGPAPNTVRGVLPGEQPWVIARLSVDVKLDGQISVDGRGLLLAGGNGIGTNGGQIVFARLFCGPVATQTTHDSGAVLFDPAGDFRIEDVLIPAPPDQCTTPVLLIVGNLGNGGDGPWLAAGIPKQ